MFDILAEEALAAYDRIIGLDLAEASLDGSQHKAPCGGEGARRELHRSGPIRLEVVHRGRHGQHSHRLGHRWRNRHDMVLLEPPLDAAADRGLLADIGTLHLHRVTTTGSSPHLR